MRYIVQARPDHSIIASGTANDEVITLEGNWYFAPESVDMRYLRVTERTYTCPYKGVCFWIDLDSPTLQARNIGWVYNNPKPGYEFIQNRIGFYSRDTAGTLALREVEDAA